MTDTWDQTSRGQRLTAAEIDFAIAAGIPPIVFSEQAERENAAHERWSQQVIEAEMRTWPTVEDVARLLDMQPSAVRHLIDGAGLIGVVMNGLTVISPWQFTARGRLLPGLPEVLAAMPPDFGPHEAQTVMTAPLDEFDGKTPALALECGCPVPAIVEWVSWLGGGT